MDGQWKPRQENFLKCERTDIWTVKLETPSKNLENVYTQTDGRMDDGKHRQKIWRNVNTRTDRRMDSGNENEYTDRRTDGLVK